MSSLIVEVCRIDELKPHPNAERLELATVKGWQCVVGKGLHKPGDIITYIPIDCVLPIGLSDQLGVTKYLSNGRVRCAKLRGEPSFGIIAPSWGVEGENVAEAMAITKYVPPMKLTAGDAEPSHPLFDTYTDIENMRNFPEVFTPDEAVIGTEKIHGTNSRIGLIEGFRLAGSKGLQRKEGESIYWHPWTLPGVQSLMASFPDSKSVILYGEIYGKVQSLRYGVKGIAYRAFDCKVDGKYLDFPEFERLCNLHDVPQCPVILSGFFDFAKVRAAASGASTIDGADHMREGVVVRPMRERTNEKIGRAILKYVSDDYLLGGKDESETSE